MRCVRYTEVWSPIGHYLRCEAEAVVRLYAWDGKPVPGGLYCQAHADECIAEYREKLGKEWTLRAVDEFGKEVAA